jgi:5'-nucleotidase (lipoprotein e(P4) family)
MGGRGMDGGEHVTNSEQIMKTTLFLATTLLALHLAGCASADGATTDTTSQEVTTPAATTPMPDSLHWFRDSAEYKASARQAYGLAAAALNGALADRYSDVPWTVIMDGDETILDNSQFEKEGWQQGVSYTPARWSAWVQRREAGAVPGAIAFSKKVHDLGGSVVVVTNRAAGDDCNATEDNLKKLGFPYEAIFCQVGTVSDKNPRFQAIQNGTNGMPAHDVLMWIGDNILDFPNQSQDIRSGGDDAFADFGSRFVVIPNPVYGSWQKNAED